MSVTDNINYIDRNDGEVIITGCHDCPFLHYEERKYFHNPYCSLDNKNKEIYTYINRNGIPDYFPEKCRIRKPNFSLIRKLGN